MDWTRAIQAFGIVALCSSASAANAGPWKITTLVAPGSTYNQAFGINDSNTVVGVTDAGGFVYSGGSFTILTGPAGSLGSSATGISNGGTVVGSYYTTTLTDPDGNVTPGPQSGFVYQGGTYTSLNAPGAYDTFLRAISTDGRYISGYADLADGSNFWGFVYDRNSSSFKTIVSGPSLNIAHGVNSHGVVVGSTGSFGFVYDSATDSRTDSKIGSASSRYRGINDAGQIAGFYISGGITHSFIGSPSVYQVFDVPGAFGTSLEGINNAGAIAGIVNDEFGNASAFLATPVPEPSIAALLLAGLAGLAWRRRST
jgi:hypothetical protein